MLVKVGQNQFTLPRGEGVGKSQKIIRTREQQVFVRDLCHRPGRQRRGRGLGGGATKKSVAQFGSGVEANPLGMELLLCEGGSSAAASSDTSPSVTLPALSAAVPPRLGSDSEGSAALRGHTVAYSAPAGSEQATIVPFEVFCDRDPS